ncbi:MAG: hypothetical protein ABI983_03520 [Acidobacteriota bacterium]
MVTSTVVRFSELRSRYGHVCIVDRMRLEKRSRECYEAIRAQFVRLRI